MRKTVIFILSAMVFTFINIACNNQNKTTMERIREEKKAIERYLDRRNIQVLKSYPQNGVFGANEYFLTGDGLYMQVVDSGNGRRVKPLIDQVQVRFESMHYVMTYVSGDTASIKLDHTWFPMQFIYGLPGSYATDPSGLPCDGWAIPLLYVGEGAIVNLIIPSKLGNATDNAEFSAVAYKNLRYTNFY
jgi:hypothetical protein